MTKCMTVYMLLYIKHTSYSSYSYTNIYLLWYVVQNAAVRKPLECLRLPSAIFIQCVDTIAFQQIYVDRYINRYVCSRYWFTHFFGSRIPNLILKICWRRVKLCINWGTSSISPEMRRLRLTSSANYKQRASKGKSDGLGLWLSD